MTASLRIINVLAENQDTDKHAKTIAKLYRIVDFCIMSSY
jgi:hypothetical protein